MQISPKWHIDSFIDVIDKKQHKTIEKLNYIKFKQLQLFQNLVILLKEESISQTVENGKE